MNENHTPEEVLKEYLLRIEDKAELLKFEIDTFFTSLIGQEDIGDALNDFRPKIMEFLTKYNNSFPHLLKDDLKLVIESMKTTHQITSDIATHFSLRVSQH